MPIIRRPHVTTIDTGEMVWGPLSGPFPGLGDAGTINLNDADNSLALVFSCPKAGVLSQVGFYVTNIVGTPPAYQVGFVLPRTSPISYIGDPTTTLYGDLPATLYTFTQTGYVWITLDHPPTVTAGECIYVRIWPGDVAPDASNYVQLRSSISMADMPILPRRYAFTSYWATTSTYVVGVRYADGSLATPLLAPGPVSFTDYSTPDERGACFTLPFRATCRGVKLIARSFGVTIHYYVALYDSAGSKLRDMFVNTDYGGVSSLWPYSVHWEALELAPNTVYRVACRQAVPHASYNLTVSMPQFEDEATRKWFPQGERWQGTYRTDGGAWTDDPLSLFGASLLLSEIEVVS